MRLFKSLRPLLLTALTLGSSMTMSYDIVERATLIDDRFKTMEMMRPFGHDFVLPDLNATISTNILDLQDAVKEIDNLNFDDNETQQAIDSINNSLNEFFNKEQVLRANFGFQVPIFSFTAGDFNIKPRIKTNFNLIAVLTPRTEKLSFTDVVNNLDQIPAELRSALADCISGLDSTDDGKDLLDPANGCVTQAQANQIKEAYDITELKFDTQVLTGTNDIPLIDTYVKADLRAGLWFDYEKDTKDWFGTFGLYALGRADLKVKADAALLLAGAGDTEVSNNMLLNAVIDYRLGYRYENYSFQGSVEELKLTELSREEEGRAPAYGTDALLRFHADALYELSFLKIKPFLGTHKRGDYGFGDGFYAGADTSFHFWEDRIGMTIRTMVDQEHFTLGLNTKLWVMFIDLNGKFAVKDEIDGFKVNNYYYANIRFFF